MVLLLCTGVKGSEYVFPPLPHNIANESGQSREKGNEKRLIAVPDITDGISSDF